MVNDDLLGRIFSVASAAWTFVLINAVALFKAWPNIMARVNERRRDQAAEEMSDWTRLREERDGLQRRLTECEKERVKWMARAITAEATLQGYGELRQIRAISEAAKRLPPKIENGDK